MTQKIEKNQDGTYKPLDLRCGILPYFINKNNQIVWGCIRSNRLGAITITPAAGVQDLLISNDKENIILEVGKPLPDLKHEALKEFIGRHLRDGVYQSVLAYFEKNDYIIAAEDPWVTALHETEEEHGIDLREGGHDHHLLQEFTAIQENVKSRGAIKFWLAELQNSEGVVLKHTDKIENKIRRNQGNTFFEEGCWGTVEEFKSSLEKQRKYYFNQSEHDLKQSELITLGMDDCQDTIDLLMLLEKQIRNKNILLSQSLFSVNQISAPVTNEQDGSIEGMGLK